MNTKFIIVLIFLIPNILISQNIRLRLNFSGAEEFLKLVQSDSIDTSKINRLLSTEPYQKMCEWTKSGLRLNMVDLKNIFYHALLNYDLDKKYKTDDFCGQMISYMIECIKNGKSNPEILHQKIIELKNNFDVDSIKRITLKYIPEENIDIDITIYFVVGLAQGVVKGNYAGIEILYASNNESTYLWLAHELYHCFTLRLPYETIVDSTYETLNKILYYLVDEGIATAISDPSINEREIEFANAYLMRFDFILKIAFKSNQKKKFDNLKKTIDNPTAHDVGKVMAHIIKEQFGITELKNCARKPKLFLLKYQEAAKKINNPEIVYIFDELTVKKIKELKWEIRKPE
ncbi:MAG: DUF5700 domain-containing putative Zn-dependent protease [candidate division WOR-3 bacterium]